MVNSAHVDERVVGFLSWIDVVKGKLLSGVGKELFGGICEDLFGLVTEHGVGFVLYFANGGEGGAALSHSDGAWS